MLIVKFIFQSFAEIPISPDFLPILASMAELLKLICHYVDLSVQAGILEMVS